MATMPKLRERSCGRFRKEINRINSAKIGVSSYAFRRRPLRFVCLGNPAKRSHSGRAARVLRRSISSQALVFPAREVESGGDEKKVTLQKLQRCSTVAPPFVCNPPERKIPPGK